MNAGQAMEVVMATNRTDRNQDQDGEKQNRGDQGRTKQKVGGRNDSGQNRQDQSRDAEKPKAPNDKNRGKKEDRKKSR